MGNFKQLSDELKKLQKQIDTLFSISEYQKYDDLSGLSDFNQLKTADQLQQLEEYQRMFYLHLEDVKCTLDYYDRSVREVGTLHMNSQGRYETESGYYYTSGSCIEFLRKEERYNTDTEDLEEVEIWTTSRVENENGKYYIVDYPKVALKGLRVRIRK